MSTIATQREDIDFIKSLFPNKKPVLSILMRGSEDGFTSQQFKKKDKVWGKGPTIILVKTEFNKTFGAYTSVPWAKPTNGIYY